MKQYSFSNIDCDVGRRLDYFSNGNGRYFSQYREYFKSCGWKSYGPLEEISKNEYMIALSIHVSQLDISKKTN